MASTTKVKICGLKTEAALEAALAGGADYVGLVFFPPSPRNLAPRRRRAALAARARGRARIVALMVDPDDALIEAVVASADPDLLQLHGEETPERVARGAAALGQAGDEGHQGRDRRGRRGGARLSRHRRPHPVRCPRARATAPAPAATARPSTGARSAASRTRWPYMLSGGLTPDNVAEAIRIDGRRHGRRLLGRGSARPAKRTPS